MFLNRIRQQKPLVHCMTNMVVANFQANGLLSLGASPIMADALEEAADIAGAASVTVLNIGTLKPAALQAMTEAGKSANRHGVPVVLDPVGAGATAFRKKSVFHLLQEIDLSLIRCNAGELAAIAGVKWDAKGVDAGSGTADIASMAKQVAEAHRCLVAVTGETDIVTDGKTVSRITGGHPLMSRVTGMGCLLSGVAGAFLCAAEENRLQALTEGLVLYSLAGEKAAGRAQGPGSFASLFLDELYRLTADDSKKVNERCVCS